MSKLDFAVLRGGKNPCCLEINLKKYIRPFLSIVYCGVRALTLFGKVFLRMWALEQSLFVINIPNPLRKFERSKGNIFVDKASLVSCERSRRTDYKCWRCRFWHRTGFSTVLNMSSHRRIFERWLLSRKAALISRDFSQICG